MMQQNRHEFVFALYLGGEALAMATPRRVEINKNPIEGSNGGVEAGLVQFNHRPIQKKLVGSNPGDES
jgi:hypothetical protein